MLFCRHESMNIGGNMKIVIALCLLAGLAASNAQDAYATKYDNVDIDEILNNERVYKKYLDCLLNQGKCTEDAKYLKEIIPDALQNGCEKCTEKQKAGGEKVLKYAIENKPDDYRKVAKIYDPEGIYTAKYNEKAKELGIKLIE